MTAEDVKDRAVRLLHAPAAGDSATSLKGRAYNNNYCWRMRFSGDRVSEFREYCDTHHAYEVLFEQ